MDTAKPSYPHNLVQPVAVLRNKGSHYDVIRAVAEASVGAYLANGDSDVWQEWLSRRFTKTVRRGRHAQLKALDGLCRSKVLIGEVLALSFDPMAYEDFPEALTKMQVSDFERPKEKDTYKRVLLPDLLTPKIFINSSLGMSTGKTAAQVSHGLMAWVIKWGIERYNPFIIEEIPTLYKFEELKEKCEIVINDAGFTELAPGSSTVLVTH